jgi:hypothetical protein
MIKTLLKGETPRNIDYLTYQIKKYCKAHSLPTTPETTEPPRAASTTPPPTTTPSETSLERGTVFQQSLKDLYRLRGHLHGQLHAATTDSDRYELMFQLHQTQTQIDKIHKGEEAANTAQAANALALTKISAVDFKRARNLKQYIQRAEKQMQEDPAKTEKLTAKIATWQEELNRITWEN